jgi:hypothetical protein
MIIVSLLDFNRKIFVIRSIYLHIFDVAFFCLVVQERIVDQFFFRFDKRINYYTARFQLLLLLQGYRKAVQSIDVMPGGPLIWSLIAAVIITGASPTQTIPHFTASVFTVPVPVRSSAIVFWRVITSTTSTKVTAARVVARGFRAIFIIVATVTMPPIVVFPHGNLIRSRSINEMVKLGIFLDYFKKGLLRHNQ